MWGFVSHRSRGYILRCTFLFGIIFIICSGILGKGFVFNVAAAHAMAKNDSHMATVACPSPTAPTNQSLLVVLLDRSGSLTEGTSPTDPNGYSTSVTKALTDLWPGQMAVIPFAGDTTQLPIFGPDTLSDPTQRADLKNKVQNYPIGGDTPLGPAMHEALDLLHQKGSPPGSRVIVITDGNPTGLGNNDGPHQEQDIRNHLIAQFCNQGIPVSAFGLTIDSNTPDGQDANHLLSDITKGTGATYSNVKSPEDLAREVITLYARWLNLSFTPVQGQGGNFPVSIDTFAQQVSIVSFRSDNNYNITLVGPDGQRVTQGVQRSTDRHYEIDSLNVSGPIIAGTYTVNTGGDPNAQVYALVSSPLQVQLIAPTPKTIAYDNSVVPIQAQFLKGQDILTPSQGQGQIVASVTLLVNGQPAGPPTNDVVLRQQRNTAIFSGQTLIYNQVGQLQIQVQGTYQQVKRQTSLTLQLLKPPLPPPPPPKPCSLTDIKCQWQQNRLAVIFVSLPILLLLIGLVAWLVWLIVRRRREQPKPYGYLTNGRPNGDVDLSRFRRPVISSIDLQTKGHFNFGLANFELVFPKDGKAYIRLTRSNPSKIAIDFPGEPKPKEVTGKEFEIKPGRKIYVNDRKVASFETSSGKRWT